jgi:hypothetical protein
MNQTYTHPYTLNLGWIEMDDFEGYRICAPDVGRELEQPVGDPEERRIRNWKGEQLTPLDTLVKTEGISCMFPG